MTYRKVPKIQHAQHCRDQYRYDWAFPSEFDCNWSAMKAASLLWSKRTLEIGISSNRDIAYVAVAAESSVPKSPLERLKELHEWLSELGCSAKKHTVVGAGFGS